MLRFIREKAAEKVNCRVYHKLRGFGRIKLMCYDSFSNYACIEWDASFGTALVKVGTYKSLLSYKSTQKRIIRIWIRNFRRTKNCKMAQVIFQYKFYRDLSGPLSIVKTFF